MNQANMKYANTIHTSEDYLKPLDLLLKKFNSVDFVLVTGCLCELKYTGLPHYKRNSWAQFAKLKFIVTDKTLLHE